MKATKFSEYLQNREELKIVDTPHWIYVFEAIVWSSFIMAMGFFINQFIANTFIYPALGGNANANGFIINAAAWIAFASLWGSIVFAVIYFLKQLAFYASTYIFASDRRLYMKTGLIRVLVNEVSFDEIRKTDINYGFFGRFLGYAKLIMDARFVEDTDLPFIHTPEKFAKLIHYENDLINDVNLSYVTNGVKEDADKVVPRQDDVKHQVDKMDKQAEFCEEAFDRKHDEKLDIEKNKDNDPIHDDFESAVEDIADGNDDHDIDKPAQGSLSRVDI